MKTTVFVGTSVDGYLARPDGTFDFLMGSGSGADNGFDSFLSTVDAIVMGRNTYDVVLPFPEWPYGARPLFVLTSRPIESVPAGAVVEALSGTPVEVVAQLATRGFQHVYVDGGLTIQSFLRAGLVDRIVVTRVPVLIGTGIPLFGPLNADVRLRHLGTREIAGEAVQSEYEVVKEPKS
jgi:dihydrofolate reductase